MRLFIVPGSELPIYRQIFRQVVQAIAGGHLKAGEQLPSHRELAETLVIAPLTVKKAYDELEREGHIHTVRGRGTFVSDNPKGRTRPEKLDRLRELATSLVGEAYLAGVDYGKVLEILEGEEARFRAGRGRKARP